MRILGRHLRRGRVASTLAVSRLLIGIAAIACGTPSSDDAGPADAGYDAAATTTIAFSAPDASVRYAHGTLRLQLVTTGQDPHRVELWRDGALLVVLTPPYTYDWLSDEEAEGEHVFEARALIAGVVVATAERRFEIDRTPPTLVAATPPTGATGTPLSTPIELTFSEPLAAATIDDASVRLEASGIALPHTRTLSADETTITLRLSSAPTLPATAVATATSAITDHAGNALEADATHSVEYPAWLVVISTSALPTATPYVNEIEIDQSGVVWMIANDGDLSQFNLLRWEDGLLGTPIPIGAGTVGRARTAQLRLSSTGRPVVAYTGPAIHVEMLEADGTWSPYPNLPITVDSTFDLELGPGDVPHVLRNFDPMTHEVLALEGSVWTRVADTISTYASNLDLALDPTNVYVTYPTTDGTYLGVLTSTGAWDFTRACQQGGGGYVGCVDVRLVAYRGDSVRALVGSYINTTGFMRVYTATVFAPPAWTIEYMEDDWWFSAAGGTPTGYVAVQHSMAAAVVRDETGRTWPIPLGLTAQDIDAHAGRPLIAGGEGLLAPNEL